MATIISATGGWRDVVPRQLGRYAAPMVVVLVLLMPALKAQGDPVAPPIEAFTPEPGLGDDLAFIDLEELQANLTEPEAPQPTSTNGGYMPAEPPPDMLPTDTFAPIDSIPLAPTPGIPETPSSRSRPQERITNLVSLLSPPPPGSPPFDLTPEQQAAIPTYESWRKGRITVGVSRNTGNLGPQTMACRTGYLNDHFADHWVGIPEALYRSGELCGACVRIACVDEACEEALVRREVFMIVDKCMDCQGGSLVVSAGGMQNLTGLNVDLNPTTIAAWEFVSCAPLIEDGIKMLPSSENRRNYLGLNFSNSRQLLRAVAINGIRMTPTDFGMWVIDTPEEDIPLASPYTLQLLGMNGQLLSTQIPALRPQDLGIQFEGV